MQQLNSVRMALRPSAQDVASEERARTAIAEFERTQWFIAFMVAFALDVFFDLPAAIPIIGIPISLLSLPLVVYIVIFNFRHGALHAKIMRFLILLADMLPLISPFLLGNMAIVALMWNHARRKKNMAQKYLSMQAQKRRVMYAAAQQVAMDV